MSYGLVGTVQTVLRYLAFYPRYPEQRSWRLFDSSVWTRRRYIRQMAGRNVDTKVQVAGEDTIEVARALYVLLTKIFFEKTSRRPYWITRVSASVATTRRSAAEVR